MRKLTRSRFLMLSLLVPVLVLAQSQSKISAPEAKNHVGERTTVCGQVVSTHYADRTKGNPTFLNLDEPYPKQIFTVVIWGTDMAKFGDPEAKYASKRICVTGLIKDYRGTPEVIADEPGQIEIQK
jgi:DNA/RNA endonuclease YhcR with UshA esterase domain